MMRALRAQQLLGARRRCCSGALLEEQCAEGDELSESYRTETLPCRGTSRAKPEHDYTKTTRNRTKQDHKYNLQAVYQAPRELVTDGTRSLATKYQALLCLARLGGEQHAGLVSPNTLADSGARPMALWNAACTPR